MPNLYYNFTPEFIPGTKARSDEVNVQYQNIEAAFDNLPSSVDAITTGTATFAPESGAGNAYVVTMPDTRLSNQDGDHIVFYATHTNTGAATLDVDGIGAVALVNWNGNAMVGGEIVTGQLYNVRYDATNVQFVLEASADAALQKGYAQEWANNAVGVLVSTAAGGDGVTDYSALHWGEGAEQWAIRAEDDPIPTMFGGDGASTYSAFHWAQKASGSSGVPLGTTTDAVQRYESGTGWLEETSFRISVDGYVSIDDGQGSFPEVIAFPATVPGGTPVTDPNLGSVTFLASAENAVNGAETFTPEIGPTMEWNIVSGTQPTQVDGGIRTAQAKLGTRSIYWKDGAGGINAGWNSSVKQAGSVFGFTGDFTIEMDVYITNLASAFVPISIYDFGEYQWQLNLEASSGRLNFLAATSGTTALTVLAQEAWGGGAVGFTTGSWQHLAVCRQGNNWYAFRNGVLSDGGVNTTAMTIHQPTDAYLCMGQPGFQDGSGDSEGYIDNVRITDGVARYTTNFTPPSVPFDGSASISEFTLGDPSYTTVIDSFSYVRVNAPIQIAEQTSFADVGDGFGHLWVRDDTPNKLVFTDDSGKETVLGSGGGIMFERWIFDSTVNVPQDPGTGELRFSSGTPSVTTAAYISDTTGSGLDPDEMLSLLSNGGTMVVQNEDRTSFLYYAVTAVVDNTTWWQLTLDYKGGNNVNPANGEELTVQFFPNPAIEQGTETASASDILYWEGASNRWEASGSQLRVNPNSPPLGGRIQLGSPATTVRTSPNINQDFLTSGQGSPWRVEDGGSATDNFGSFASFAVSPAYMQYEIDDFPWMRMESDGDIFIYDWETQGGASTSGIYWQEKAAAAPDVTGYGQFWIRSADGVAMFTGDDGVDRELSSGVISTPLQIYGDTDGSAPLTQTARLEYYDLDGSDLLAYVGFSGTQTFQIRNQNHGANFEVVAEDAAGVAGTYFVINPDAETSLRADTDLELLVANSIESALIARANGEVELYFNGTETFRTATNAAAVKRSDTSDSTAAQLQYMHSNDVVRGWIGYDGLAAGRFVWNNDVHGGGFRIDGETAGGVAQLIFSATPGANDTIIASNGISELVVGTDKITANSLFLNQRASAVADVANDGQFWVRDRTVCQPWFTDDAGVDYPLAFAVARRVATNASWNMNTGNNDYNSINGLAYYTNSTAYTITLENSTSTNFPIDASMQIISRGTGTITISEGTGVTLYTDDGTGFADSLGSSTLVGGAATLYRASATTYLLWGSGLTI